jgi:hypothetical protein
LNPSTLANIEKAYLRSQNTETAAEAKSEAPPEASTLQADGPDAAALAQRLAALRATAEGVPEPVRTKMLGALDKAAQQIQSGDTAKAAKSLDPLEKALSKFSEPAETVAEPVAAAENPTDPADNPDAKADTANPALAEKWTEAAAKLEPAVLAALSAGKGNTDAIRLKFYGMQDQAEAGNHKAALAQVADLTTMLREAQNAPTVNFDEIPKDVVPFAKSRVAWANTRAQLRAELGKLKSAMDAALANIDGMEGASSETGKLFSYLDTLDGRLEQTLDTLTNTPDGTDRQTLKAKARDIIAEYSAELDGDFFRDVDGDNGFAPVKLRGPAVSALQRIGAVLAA